MKTRVGWQHLGHGCLGNPWVYHGDIMMIMGLIHDMTKHPKSSIDSGNPTRAGESCLHRHVTGWISLHGVLLVVDSSNQLAHLQANTSQGCSNISYLDKQNESTVSVEYSDARNATGKSRGRRGIWVALSGWFAPPSTNWINGAAQMDTLAGTGDLWLTMVEL